MNRRKKIFILIVIMCVVFGIYKFKIKNDMNIEYSDTQISENSIEIDGVKRWYLLYVPKNISENKPLLLLLHGGQQGMRNIFSDNALGTKAWRDIADREGFAVIIPNGMNAKNADSYSDKQNWNFFEEENPVFPDSNYDDVKFLTTLVDKIAEDLKVDKNRIYITGSSNGGMMTHRMLREKPEMFAAAATFISNLPVSEISKPSISTPILLANSTDDPLVPFNGGKVDKNSELVRSAGETVNWFIKTNNADTENVKYKFLPNLNNNDKCVIKESIYPKLSGNTDSVPVHYYEMMGGGHTMPSIKYVLPKNPLIRWIVGNQCNDVEGAELAWDFLKNFSR